MNIHAVFNLLVLAALLVSNTSAFAGPSAPNTSGAAAPSSSVSHSSVILSKAKNLFDIEHSPFAPLRVAGNRKLDDPTLPASTAAPIPYPHVNQRFGQPSLYLIENRGQLDPRVAFYIQGQGKTIYFTPEGVTFALLQTPASSDPSNTPRPSNSHAQRWIVKLDFVGANPTVRPVGQAQTETIISYFKGAPANWHTAIPTFARIVYADLWPGIDLVYYGTSDRLKYEFIVHPGADPNQIQLAYRGATNVALNAAGRLKVSTPIGSFADDTPIAYQEIDGQRVNVEMAYALTPSLGEGESANRGEGYGFSIAPYDPTRPLILDPAILIYCGYIGGDGEDNVSGIAVDTAGYAYITGYVTQGTSFPVIVGPDTSYNEGYDAFVAKVQADGTGLVYAGYIGGDQDDSGADIAVDSSGNAYVTGYTYSDQSTFPVAIGPDTTFNGITTTTDVFVAKIKADGTGLVYAGYIGGADSDEGNGIVIDSAGNVYVTGQTNSTEATFPVKTGPDLSFNGPVTTTDAFVVEVKADGTGLEYAGYNGGSQSDIGWDIAIDSQRNIYVTGETKSSEVTFPVNTGPDLTYAGNSDAFVAKVNLTGTAFVYAGYIGGSGLDAGHAIAIDSAGSAYIAGGSASASGFATVGPDLDYNGGSNDAFIAKVNPGGTGLIYAGYIGGMESESGYGIALDGTGSAYITGFTRSDESSFPVVGGPDWTFNGGSDAFVARVNAAGTGLVFAGYIGGSQWDTGWDIAVDAESKVYVTGGTSSTDLPTLKGPDLTHNAAIDAFVAQVFWLTKTYLPVVLRNKQ